MLRFMPGGEAAAARAVTDAEMLARIWSEAWAGQPGYAPWAAVVRRSGALAGQIGLRWLPWNGGTIEVLWMLGRAYRGRGLATEGGRAALAGLPDIELAAVECFVMPGNAASLAVVRRLGMEPLELLKELGVQRFRLTRDRWLEQEEPTCTIC